MKNKIDKQALRDKINNLEGLSNDDKSLLLTLLAEQKKYGLVWEDHPEEAEELLRDNIPVLREVPERRILSKDTFMGQESEEESPNHIIIEGDNLHALTALTYTHEGKIDVIYIDPPYNTGNKDFVYNDNFVDSEDGYRHSKWLSFMEKRLKIAKRLLSDKGVIFISIDDNEQANLKLLCDEIFNNSNFVAQVIWERAYAPVNLKKHFSESHDYVIIYAKNIDNAVCNGLPKTSAALERYKNPDNDIRGLWKAADATVGPAIEEKCYPITLPSGRIVYPPSGRCWLYTKERFDEILKDNRVWFGPKGDNVPSIKKFATEVKQGMTPMTVWKYTEVGHSQDAAKELKDIFGGQSKFTYPKSVRLVERIVQLYSQSSSTILDFFAGSGTTLHATMQLNSEDGGHRQCILVTNNENNICEDVTYERNKRVIEGYTTPKGQEVPGLKANNLRYYQMDFIPRSQSTANKHALMNAVTDLLCIKEDLYDEVKPFAGLNFKSSVLRYFKKDNRQMLVIYNERAVQYVVPRIAEVATKDSPIKIYVFSDGAYAYDDEFHEVKDLVELCALPDAIYQAYMRVLPPKRYDDEKLTIGDDAEEALNDEYEYNTKEGGMA